MKLLTLNTHSLAEENYYEKLKIFVSAVFREKPDIIALQEVNQTAAAAAVASCGGLVIRDDNHVFNAARMLEDLGMKYFWNWLPIKRSYGKYDEGIALMSLSPIIETDSVTVSRDDSYNDWKTRKLLGIRTESLPDTWFFSVHFGWWDDPDDPFSEQWQRCAEYMKKYGNVWLMGDFNNPAEIKGEGYDLVSASKYRDSYLLAKTKDSGITVHGIIDGWRDRLSCRNGMRIDHIRCSEKNIIKSSRVIFNGENYPTVSDHCGVIVEYERSND